MVLKVAVIGAGASGLVTLKYLLEAHKFFPGVDFEARLFEREDDLGGVFRNQVYEDAELVSSKYLTAFSDFRFPGYDPDFVTPQRYVEYLKEYAITFDIWGHISFSTTVASIERSSDGQHVLTLVNSQGQQVGTYSCDAVAVCSGLNQEPFLPNIAGLTIPLPTKWKEGGHANINKPRNISIHKGIEAIHAVNFKERSQFGLNKTVLVMGAGETGMDIAHLAITSPTKRVIICHRDGFIHAPKIVPQPYRAGGRSGGPDPNKPNKPLDCAIASLFDTAYLPSIIQRGPWPWAVYDAFIKDMAWVISGTRAGFDQWVGGVSWERFHADSLLICKSDRAMPYISAKYRSQSTLNKWRSWLLNMELKPTGGKHIDMAPWPTHVDEDGVVHFEKNKRPDSVEMEKEKGIKPDIVIFATGYTQSFPFLSANADYPSLNDSTTRGIYRNIEDGIAYIGFIRPAFGAIPPVAEVQAQHWIYHLLASPKFRRLHSPSFKPPSRSSKSVDRYELDYKLKCRDKDHNFHSTKRGVDQESYVYQLALDMGSTPTWTYVMKDLGKEVFFTWAMGPNFTTKFRLVGPWSNEESQQEAVRLMGRDGAITWALGAVLGFILLQCLYNLFLHPLHKFPGPIGRRAHVLPSVYSLFRGNWTRELLPITEKYGPVVRVGPNELVFTDPDAWKDIYSHQNGAVVKGEEFEKYMLFYRTRGFPPSILSETRDNHALLRRQLSHGFSEKSMRAQEPIITGYIDLLIRRLRERCVPALGPGGEKERLLRSRTAFDMRHWYTFTTFDLIGDLAFGAPFGCLEKGETTERVSTIEKGVASQQNSMAVKLLGLQRFIPLLAKGRARFQRDILQQMADTLRQRMGLNVERPDFIEGLLKKQKDWNIPFDLLRSNASLLVIAGSETTATLLSGITYLLLTNPECLQKVTQEVRSAFNSEEDITFSSVQNLSYMLACLKEAMRRYPPVPGSMPRVVPRGGAHIAGHFVPEGTTVSVAQYPMFNSSRNISDPFSFKPERFIEPEKFPGDRIDAVQAFSVGPRDCIGKNLAYAEMRTILARILFNFDLELADPQQDWLDHNAFFLWSKPALEVYLTPVR